MKKIPAHDDLKCPICRSQGDIPSHEAFEHMMGNLIAQGSAKEVRKNGEPAFKLTRQGRKRAESLIHRLILEGK